MPWVQANGVRLYYELTGEESGVPFVFIAGTGVHGKEWRQFQVPFFSTRHYRVLNYDHRGTGDSDKPETEYSTELFADDLAALMDSLGLPPAHVLGHSMGGRVAQMLALRHPRKVKSVIFASTGPGSNKASPMDLPLEMCIEMIHDGYLNFLNKHVRSDFMYPPDFKREHPEFVEEQARMFMVQPPPLHAYLRHVIARQRHNALNRIREISQPALVIVGEDDVVNNHRKQSEDLVKLLPNAELVLVPGTRHKFLWQKADLANQLILDFVRRH